jgi:hypothetical protein
MGIVGVSVGLLASMLIVGGAGAALGDSVTGSVFEGVDGNKVKDDSAKGDWDLTETAPSNISRATPKSDNAIGSEDDSFAGGMKEDTSSLAFVTGSIPSNKSDLRYLYLATENDAVENAHIYMHLGWERAQSLGSANMDFEFNQNRCTATATANCENVTNLIPKRKAGDMLIAYDFGGNSGTVDLGAYRWLDSTLPAGNPLLELGCEASSALPCWSKRQSLSTIGARAAISEDTKFGEASIDLTVLLGASECRAFGSVYLKSRSSASFTAQMKDFIAPLAQGVSNCHVKASPNISITKVDDNTSPMANVRFQLFTDGTGGTAPGTAVTGKYCDTGSAGTCSITSVDPGNGGAGTGTYYWVVEQKLVNGVYVTGQPDGYAPDPTTTLTAPSTALQRRVQVLDSSSAGPSLTFTNPRKFKIVTLVCQESTNRLYPSSIQAFGAAAAATTHGTGLTAEQQQAVCALTSGATRSGTRAELNLITGVTVPATQP